MATNRLQERYRDEVVPALMDEFKFTRRCRFRASQSGVEHRRGRGADNPKPLDGAVEDLRKITGQQPVITKAEKSIANFKLREGRAIGVKGHLRGERMWALLDRLINIALPRIRDFRGCQPRCV